MLPTPNNVWNYYAGIISYARDVKKLEADIDRNPHKYTLDQLEEVLKEMRPKMIGGALLLPLYIFYWCLGFYWGKR